MGAYVWLKSSESYLTELKKKKQYLAALRLTETCCIVVFKFYLTFWAWTWSHSYRVGICSHQALSNWSMACLHDKIWAVRAKVKRQYFLLRLVFVTTGGSDLWVKSWNVSWLTLQSTVSLINKFSYGGSSLYNVLSNSLTPKKKNYGLLFLCIDVLDLKKTHLLFWNGDISCCRKR